MARRPRRQKAVATALQGVRPQRGVFPLLRRGAVALGHGAIDLFLGPLGRLIWRVLRSRSARRRCVAARRARSAWIDDPEPAGDPLLRRAVARAGGAIQAMIAPGRRALAVVRILPQRALSLVRQFLQRVRGVVPGFFLRLLLPWQQPPPQQQQQQQPPPPPPQRRALAALYEDNPLRRRRPRSPPPPPPPPPPEPHYVDGVEVPQWVVDRYAFYCSLASTCPAKWTICHFCVFEIQRSKNFSVRTYSMIQHCKDYHACDGPSVRCNETNCSVSVRPGRDLVLHKHFCH